MTEQQWQTCIYPRLLLRYLYLTQASWKELGSRARKRVRSVAREKDSPGRPGADRKARLFAVACCRGLWPLLGDERSRQAVELAEALATRPGEGNQPERQGTARAARRAADEATPESATRWAACAAWTVLAYSPWLAALTVPGWSDVALKEMGWREGWQRATFNRRQGVAHRKGQKAAGRARAEGRRLACAALRCIFGNPFRPVAISPSWRTPDVLALARAIDEERAFDRAAILGDALQDAGCGDEQILAHCGGPALHVRGCFVVDALLERN
jgi:hypothetical protein